MNPRMNRRVRDTMIYVPCIHADLLMREPTAFVTLFFILDHLREEEEKEEKEEKDEKREEVSDRFSIESCGFKAVR